ncbi:MAG: phytanoyl-CoA dioxygenase family protein [Planctomycetes bacterium]|nr:phytanoyl-CoA dioxygenase family protein [Planctomycetota bacterium]
MAFKFCDSMIHRYRTEGYVIFRQVLPVSLVRDLRHATATAQEQARKKSGQQAQRLQPLSSYDIDPKPFADYANLAPLVDAISKILTPRHKLGKGDSYQCGLLLEPAELPWCTAWHRDIRETHEVPDVEEFRRITTDPLWFNQINCPLYEDNCTWYVPGSYLRQFDLDGETKASTAKTCDEKDGYLQRERSCLEYTQAMPHCIRASMDAGDFMLYHPNGWHIGNYLPDRKRVTIHDFAPTPELIDWYDRWGKSREAAQKKRDAEKEAVAAK